MEPPNAIPTIEPEVLAASFAPSGTLVHCNDAWSSVLGPADAPWAYLIDDDQDVAAEAVLEAGKGSLVTNQVLSAHTADREDPLPVLLNFMPVHAPDGTQDIAAVTINGEVMAEPPSWMISQTQRHRMEALGRMTMGVAHDLNNLLSGLIGHIELLREEAEETGSVDGLQSSIRTIEQTAEDGAALIEKLQRYIRQDTEEHFEQVDLSALVDDCITLTQPYWYNEPRREGIEIEVETALSEVPPIQGAAAELREVFVNLILNAVQAMPDGGTLSFETYVADRSVCARVHDTGIGMSDDVQANIFEPLFTTKGEDGTGMGLAASYGIVQEHDGDIEVASTPGEGTSFTLLFPSTVPSPAATEENDVTPTQDDSVQVLVVDDDEMVRSTVRKLLTLKDHAVDCAASGAEALALIEQTSYDIVFTDYGMPEMTGAGLARTLHTRHPEMPVVLLTGYTELETEIDDVEAVISKPFKLDELQQAIQSCIFDGDASG
jgi:signal transduction histidine kinase/ActR/RegA family two-component response regulator